MMALKNGSKMKKKKVNNIQYKQYTYQLEVQLELNHFHSLLILHLMLHYQ